MGREIERKFLVRDLPAGIERFPSSEIRQGYVAIEADGGEVRVRRRDDHAELTFKRGSGRSRAEHELLLDADEFSRLWPLTEGRRVEKRRYELPLDGDLTLELDVYAGALAGLATAEVEFPSEAAAEGFEPPGWLGREVTDDGRFKNQALAVAGAPGSVAASVDTVRSAAVVASASTAGAAAVAASAATAGSAGVVASAATAGGVAVAASLATAGSAGVFASALTVLGAGVSGSLATLACIACEGCVACVGCIDCVNCFGCVGCVGLRDAVGEVGRRRARPQTRLRRWLEVVAG